MVLMFYFCLHCALSFGVQVFIFNPMSVLSVKRYIDGVFMIVNAVNVDILLALSFLTFVCSFIDAEKKWLIIPTFALNVPSGFEI